MPVAHISKYLFFCHAREHGKVYKKSHSYTSALRRNFVRLLLKIRPTQSYYRTICYPTVDSTTVQKTCTSALTDNKLTIHVNEYNGSSVQNLVKVSKQMLCQCKKKDGIQSVKPVSKKKFVVQLTTSLLFIG